MVKTMKIFSWLISAVLVLIVACLAFIYFSPGYSLLLVRSESMRPAINMGDLIVTVPVNGPVNGEVKPGTIVTYQHGKESFTHRVVSVDGETLVTKGDATEDPDPWAVTLSDVEGIYLFKIPYIGFVTSFKIRPSITSAMSWFISCSSFNFLAKSPLHSSKVKCSSTLNLSEGITIFFSKALFSS